MNEPKSVLIVETAGYGGIGEYAGLLAEALAAEGWQVQLATARQHVHGDRLVGVRVLPIFSRVREDTRVGGWLRRTRLARPLTGVLHLVAVVRLLPVAREARVVHTQGAFEPPLTLVQHRLWRLAGAAIVHTPHNTFDRIGGRREKVKRMAEAASDAIIVHARADLPNLPSSLHSRVAVIPLGEYGAVARAGGFAEPDAARSEFGLPLDAPVGLLYGHLRVDKGLDMLLEAGVGIQELHLLIAGEDKGALESARDLLKHPALQGRVTVREGFHSAEESARLFAACDFVVLPYRRASSSAVLALAYGYQRAAVVSPVGGLPEAVVDGETGWICDEPTADSLAETLRKVIAEGRDEWRNKGRAGAAMADDMFGWPTIARRTIGEAYGPAKSRRAA